MARAARIASCEDHRGSAEGRSRAGELRRAPLGARGPQGGAAGLAGGGDSSYQGLPGYTFHKAVGELWRSRFDAERNLVVINNGHRDFVYAARSKMLKLRYICRLFAKELVLKNFIGIPPDQLLERLLELTLYTEENLRYSLVANRQREAGGVRVHRLQARVNVLASSV